jgi:hypothetical protein
MPQQTCIFCERAKPLVTITKEHLFSRWVDRVLTPELLGPGRSFERTAAGPDGVAARTTWPSEIIAAIEAPVVCGGTADDCNSGWMAGLDGQVRQLLEPMMLGEPRSLSAEQQLTIATWAAMKSMVLEYVWGSGQVIVVPQEARTFLYRERKPPANMQIRVAAVESRGRPALIYRRVYRLEPRAAGTALPGLASCSTLVLGCFAVQVYATSSPDISSQAAPAPHGPGYFVIWPPTGSAISWPPQALDDAGLDQFAHPLQPVTGD